VRSFLTRLSILVVLAVGAAWLWSNRDTIAVLSNNNVRIQGEWHKVEMDFTNTDSYNFSETFISLNGEEWATYRLLRGPRIEVTTSGGNSTVYDLEFPNDENMLWSTRKGDTYLVRMRWRR
jgi:hypothetical protein